MVFSWMNKCKEILDVMSLFTTSTLSGRHPHTRNSIYTAFSLCQALNLKNRTVSVTWETAFDFINLYRHRSPSNQKWCPMSSTESALKAAKKGSTWTEYSKRECKLPVEYRYKSHRLTLKNHVQDHIILTIKRHRSIILVVNQFMFHGKKLKSASFFISGLIIFLNSFKLLFAVV
jgi:hypothetical protein